MSRIGKKPIAIPSGVIVTLDGQTIAVKGPKGQLSYTAPDEVKVEQGADGLSFTPTSDSQRANAACGACRAP